MKQLFALVLMAVSCDGGSVDSTNRDACTTAIDVTSVRVWRDLTADPSSDTSVRSRTAAIDTCVADHWSGDTRACMSHTDQPGSCLTPDQDASLQAAFTAAAPVTTSPLPPTALALSRVTARVEQICACTDRVCGDVLESKLQHALLATDAVPRDVDAATGSALAALGQLDAACRDRY